MAAPIRVGVVDDHDVVREGLTLILDAAADVRVVFQGGDGADLIDAVRRGTRMDVALVDIRMPRVDGLSATATLQTLPGAPAVVVLTTFEEEPYVLGALDAGAVGFLLKRSSATDLVAAVRAAAAGDAMLSPSVTRMVLERLRDRNRQEPPDLTHLTDRERDVLALLGHGATNAEIAAQLFLSESTVKTHVSNLLARTGSRDRVQAALLAVRAGLVDG